MNKLEINVKLDRGWVIELLASGYDTYDIVTNYELSEETILDCTDLLDKEVIKQGFTFSEEFINKAIQVEYFKLEDITDLNMNTYSKLSSNFISKYKDYINWNRMILYISTQSDSFDEYVDIIGDFDLWKVISANDLPTDFIREYRDKLDWSYLSMVKRFTDEEKIEFADYILEPVQREIPEDLISTDSLKFSDKMSEEELEELISQISKLIGK